MQHITNLLKTWFEFPKNKIFCQISTINNDRPHIRTMDLYNVTEKGDLVFLTNTRSKKWSDLQNCPNSAACIVQLEHGQIIAEGKAVLKTSENDFNTTDHYWSNFLGQYWQEFYLSLTESIAHHIPDSFGVIIITPQKWEVLEINQNDFLKSTRKQFLLEQSGWVTHDLSAE
ncbi:MAG: hypothetical protein ACD_29C00417G0001 [uncultured bacterium]|nr:MAG: hypothetical protein ACD_29C00417G0001 [uncultured bacterium]